MGPGFLQMQGRGPAKGALSDRAVTVSSPGIMRPDSATGRHQGVLRSNPRFGKGGILVSTRGVARIVERTPARGDHLSGDPFRTVKAACSAMLPTSPSPRHRKVNTGLPALMASLAPGGKSAGLILPSDTRARNPMGRLSSSYRGASPRSAVIRCIGDTSTNAVGMKTRLSPGAVDLRL